MAPCPTVRLWGGPAAGGLRKSFTTTASIRPASQSEGFSSAQSWPQAPSSELPEASLASPAHPLVSTFTTYITHLHIVPGVSLLI